MCRPAVLAGAQFRHPYLTYSRLQPSHQRHDLRLWWLGTVCHLVVCGAADCHVRLISDKLASFVFWGWQAAMVSAVITLPLGITQSKEYAELEWPIDLWIAIVWVAYGWLFFGTLVKRRTKHIYVANWFYGAYVIAVALLHIVNNIVMPAGLWKSYSVYGGAVDAMAGGTATTAWRSCSQVGYLAMMYYFVPKQAQRPIYSYRLSIVHFLGADLDLHVGRPAPPALHRPA
ncbi:MAG: cbb3-type cytochrome c oxidase subunit I [Lysobacterales bacterium]